MRIGVFGSYVRGKENIDSDFDILVKFEKPISLLEFIRLGNCLSDVLDIKADPSCED